MVEGTRGKSSIVRFFHKFFYENGYNTLGRETGLVPMIYYNDEKRFVQREGELPFNILTETKIINELYNSEEIDVVIFENNAIRAEYMRSLSNYLMADVVIISTITFDHILSQGFSIEETARTFIKSVPHYSHIIFWSNHEFEYEVFRDTYEKIGRGDADILFSTLEDRELTIYKALKKIIDEKGMKIKKDINEFSDKIIYECPMDEKCPYLIKEYVPEEIFSQNIKPITFIDIGHVNDPIHTHIIFNQIMDQKNDNEVYLLLNFREDRVERIPLFIEGFIPLVEDQIKGIIIHSQNIAFTSDYLVKYAKNQLQNPDKMEFYTFKEFDEFVDDLAPQLPPESYVIMVANTADKFGYELIDKLHLFRESYPILDDFNLFELRYSKKPEDLY